MPSQDTKILEFNKNQKIDKVPFIIDSDLESLIEKIDGCKTILKTLLQWKVSEHISSGFFISAISLFKSIEHKHDVCRVKNWMKKFCESLIEHAMKIITFKKGKTKSLAI